MFVFLLADIYGRTAKKYNFPEHNLQDYNARCHNLFADWEINVINLRMFLIYEFM